MKTLFFLTGLILSGCATSIPMKDPAGFAENSIGVIIQYNYEASEPGTQNLYFRDANGKDFRVTVPKEAKPEEGIYFELPSTVSGGVRLYRFSHPDASQPADVESVFPSFYPVAGKINHVGFFNFKFERDVLYVNPIRPTDAVAWLNKAVGKYFLTADKLVNGYTGKSLPLKMDNGVARYKTNSSQAAVIKFEDKVWKCQTEENRRNLIVLGTLRFNVKVDSGKVAEVKLRESSHSASKDFEDCAQKMISDSEATQATFSADLPVIF